MAIEFMYHPEINVVETLYNGVFTNDELLASVKRTELLAKEHSSFLLLGNCLEMQKTGSVLDLYKLAEYYLSIDLSHKFREAIIAPADEEIAKGLRFYETTCVNRGYSVKVFNNRTDAIAWLK